jgi:hypothetical protein
VALQVWRFPCQGRSVAGLKQVNKRGLKRARALTLKGVIGVNEFQMHLKLLAERRRLRDLERRWRETERVALREILFASDDDRIDDDGETLCDQNDDET